MYELPSMSGVTEVVVNREVVEGRAVPLRIYADRKGDMGSTAS
jgi:ATP-dependent Clp protease ATP-binding subunit ClpX